MGSHRSSSTPSLISPTHCLSSPTHCLSSPPEKGQRQHARDGSPYKVSTPKESPVPCKSSEASARGGRVQLADKRRRAVGSYRNRPPAGPRSDAVLHRKQRDEIERPL